MDLDTEQKLIERAKTDPQAFGILFDAHYKKILGYTIRRVGDVQTAQDIVSETFMKALKELPKFRWRGVHIEAWFYTIATNEIRMYYRKRRFTSSLEELEERDGFELQDDYDLVQELQDAQEELERHREFIRAQKTMAKLPIKYQEVLSLRFVEHKKILEIASILGKREGTVKSLISRGLVILRKELRSQNMQPILTKRIVHGEGRESLVKPQEKHER